MRSQKINNKLNNYENKPLEHYISEAVGVGVIAVVLFIFISLISYYPQDATFFYYDSDFSVTKNWGGIVGSQLSGILFHLLGMSAYVFVAALAILAYMFLLGYRHGKSWLGLLLLPVCIAAAASLVSIYDFSFSHGLAGGEIGFFLSEYLTKFLGFYGAAVLSWAILWVSSVVVLQVSIVRGIIFLVKNVLLSKRAFFF